MLSWRCKATHGFRVVANKHNKVKNAHKNYIISTWYIGLYREIAIAIQKESATLMGVMCSTSQCELRSTFPNLRVTNVIRIVTFYTLPPLESPTSSWMTRSQRSRRRDKGL